MRFSLFWCQWTPKINQNGARESSESDLGSKSVLGAPRSADAWCTAHPFGYRWCDLGRHFGYRWSPRGSQNQLKLFRGPLRKRSWKQVGSGTPKKCQRQLRGTLIWVLFGCSWAPFWPPLGAKGSQSQAFWHQGCAKI